MDKLEIEQFKQKALQFANQQDVCCFLDSHSYTDKLGEFDCLIAFGTKAVCEHSTGNAFDKLQSFIDKNKQWLFGLMCYDLKNELEEFDIIKSDKLNFPDLFFFIPATLIQIKNNQIELLIGNEGIIDVIQGTEIEKNKKINSIKIEQKIEHEAYVSIIQKIKDKLKQGNIYEMNFCQEFFSENAKVNPLQIYRQLSKISPSPFSGYFKIRDKYILSASPERYLMKKDNKISSQPIKGTAKRGSNENEDLLVKESLSNNLKEQSENVMIVDLVRNDLSKIAKKGTVNVDELFGIYSFPQVHQMISTVSCQIDENISIADVFKNTFPMGSMTGAPKLSAMQLIDQYEQSKRGAYSGAMGYIQPNGNFDFNVIIRSILYNQSNSYLSFQVGSAITYQCEAEKEYDECLLKASAIKKVLKNED